ncbi:NAD dependent epimerase/dehydratase [Aspergillus alliaceus]|uniref:NAD dependent epimerase/dehydratase n=1 Tax=Petromyces alliaceus TaxID=209559 RepID=A0A5N7BWM5_PETAA|nr:NAD dependent epimerase/dehydratase [Aspergillus alliaceus]
MAPRSVALPPKSHILVTGSSGYIGSQVVNSLLELGYVVRGTVRSPKPWLDELFKQRFGQHSFDTVLVSDFDDRRLLAQIMDGISGIVHVASDVTFNPDPDTVIPWVVRAILNILEAASKQPSVKRVVLTSSSTAALVPIVGAEGVRVDESTWNDLSVQIARNQSLPAEQLGFHVYAASKTEGERQAWKWVDEHKPSFVFNSVLPNFTTGRVLHPLIKGSSMGCIRALFKGDQSMFSRFFPQWYVDVNDTARLHAIALLDPLVISQRIFAFAAPIQLRDIICALQKLRPSKMLPDPPAKECRDLTDVLPSRKAEKLLQSFYGQAGWTPLETSLANGIEDL